MPTCRSGVLLDFLGAQAATAEYNFINLKTRDPSQAASTRTRVASTNPSNASAKAIAKPHR